LRKSRHRHGRGSCSSTRGLNIAIGGNDVCWGKPSNIGAPVARKYAEDKELPIIQLKSKTESRQGKHNLQKINNLHASFKTGFGKIQRCEYEVPGKLCKSDHIQAGNPRHHSHNKGTMMTAISGATSPLRDGCSSITCR
jgi:hypothetical protein